MEVLKLPSLLSSVPPTPIEKAAGRRRSVRRVRGPDRHSGERLHLRGQPVEIVRGASGKGPTQPTPALGGPRWLASDQFPPTGLGR